MGATGEDFLTLRENGGLSLGGYSSDFTKKQAQAAGVKLTKEVLEAGNIDKLEFAASLVRLSEVVSSAVTELRKHLPTEKTTFMGVTFTPTEGGYTLNYEEDEVYRSIKADLEHRKQLLNLAQKGFTLDGGGNEVPVVGKTPRKASTTITF
jgi:hypothetical protein